MFVDLRYFIVVAGLGLLILCFLGVDNHFRIEFYSNAFCRAGFLDRSCLHFVLS